MVKLEESGVETTLLDFQSCLNHKNEEIKLEETEKGDIWTIDAKNKVDEIENDIEKIIKRMERTSVDIENISDFHIDLSQSFGNDGSINSKK